jgi:hypothetical protein
VIRKIIAVFAAVFIAAPVFAAEKPVWVTVEGESYQGEMDTLKEVKERAKRDAEAKAVEEAVGTFIKSHTLVSNSQVAEDLIYAAVRGKITKKKILASDWDAKQRNLYKVRIKALVKPVYPGGESLSAKLHLSKTDMVEGDVVKIFYQADSDCYAYIFSVAADGSVTLLLPNSTQQDHFLKAGKAYQFPPADGSISLKAMLLQGQKGSVAEEKVKLIVTRNKEDLLPLGFREGMFEVYDSRSTGMIGDLVRRLNRIEPTDWAEATAVYTIRKGVAAGKD